jgi:hypothetical protein
MALTCARLAREGPSPEAFPKVERAWRPAAAARNRGLGRSGKPPVGYYGPAARRSRYSLRRQCRRGKHAGPGTESAKVERRVGECTDGNGARRASPARPSLRLSALRRPSLTRGSGKKCSSPGRYARRGNERCRVDAKSTRHQSHRGNSDDNVIPAEGRRTLRSSPGSSPRAGLSGGPRAGIQ